MSRRFAIAAAAMMLLVSCGEGSTVPSSPGQLPSPPAATPADVSEAAINVAFQALDASREVVDVLVLTKRITPGSPQALQLAERLEQARTLLNRASAAERIGAMLESKQALDQVQGIFALIAATTKGATSR